MKKRPALGQATFGVKQEVPLKHILGKPLQNRNLQSLRPGWKTELVGTGSHLKRTCVASAVHLSFTEESFSRIIEEKGPLDSEGIWNEYFNYIGIECAPDVFNKTIAKLLALGMIETLEPVRSGY